MILSIEAKENCKNVEQIGCPVETTLTLHKETLILLIRELTLLLIFNSHLLVITTNFRIKKMYHRIELDSFLQNHPICLHKLAIRNLLLVMQVVFLLRAKPMNRF